MTTDKQDPSRVAFEAQCEYLGESTRRIFTSPDQYSSSTTALAWAMWQASREQALSEATRICKEVCHHESTPYADGFNSGALQCEQKSGV